MPTPAVLAQPPACSRACLQAQARGGQHVSGHSPCGTLQLSRRLHYLVHQTQLREGGGGAAEHVERGGCGRGEACGGGCGRGEACRGGRGRARHAEISNLRMRACKCRPARSSDAACSRPACGSSAVQGQPNCRGTTPWGRPLAPPGKRAPPPAAAPSAAAHRRCPARPGATGRRKFPCRCLEWQGQGQGQTGVSRRGRRLGGHGAGHGPVQTEGAYASLSSQAT